MDIKIIVEFSDESLKVLEEVAAAIRSVHAPTKAAAVEVKVKAPAPKNKSTRRSKG